MNATLRMKRDGGVVEYTFVVERIDVQTSVVFPAFDEQPGTWVPPQEPLPAKIAAFGTVTLLSYTSGRWPRVKAALSALWQEATS